MGKNGALCGRRMKTAEDFGGFSVGVSTKEPDLEGARLEIEAGSRH